MFGWEIGDRLGPFESHPARTAGTHEVGRTAGMLSTDAGAQGAIRREADQLQVAVEQGKFRRRRTFEHTPAGERLVHLAAARAKDGDLDALRFLYLRYADNVYGYVCSIVRDEHEAEDVTQHVFSKLMTGLARYEPRLVPFSAWILRVAHNAAIDHVRARRPVPCEEVRSRELADDVSGQERFAELRLALDALPAEQRDVIMLRFLVGLSAGEIAQRLGRSEDAVHGLQHRGRRRLRAEMRRIREEPPLPLAA
jgi:RNA polymerase sigma-70 factor (ECF subfamily)